jgi:hypothetical protein
MGSEKTSYNAKTKIRTRTWTSGNGDKKIVRDRLKEDSFFTGKRFSDPISREIRRGK